MRDMICREISRPYLTVYFCQCKRLFVSNQPWICSFFSFFLLTFSYLLLVYMLNATYVCKIASLAAIYFMTTFILSEYYKLERGRFITTPSSVQNHSKIFNSRIFRRCKLLMWKEFWSKFRLKLLKKSAAFMGPFMHKIPTAKVGNYTAEMQQNEIEGRCCADTPNLILPEKIYLWKHFMSVSKIWIRFLSSLAPLQSVSSFFSICT